MAGSKTIYIDGEPCTISLYSYYSYTTSINITNTGLYHGTLLENIWTYSGDTTFLGFSTTPGATAPDNAYKVGTSLSPDAFPNNLYVVEVIKKKSIKINNKTLHKVNDKYINTFLNIPCQSGRTIPVITFTVGSRTLYAKENMTWGEWCNSKYNTTSNPKWYIHWNNVQTYYNGTLEYGFVAYNSTEVRSQDKIEAKTYTIIYKHIV